MNFAKILDHVCTALGFLVAFFQGLEVDWPAVARHDSAATKGALLTVAWALIGLGAGKMPKRGMLTLFVLGLGIAAVAQGQTVTITVTTPKSTASATINVHAAPTITALTCMPADVLEGDPVSCTLQLDRPAPPVGYRLAVVYGIAIQGAPTEFKISPGQTQATITFPAPALPAVPGTTPAAAWNSDVERAMPMGSGYYGPIGGTPEQNGRSHYFAWVPHVSDLDIADASGPIPRQFAMVAGARIYGPPAIPSPKL